MGIFFPNEEVIVVCSQITLTYTDHCLNHDLKGFERCRRWQSRYATPTRVVTLRDKIEPAFLWFYFQSPEYWEQVADKTIGAAQPSINGQKLSDIIVPVHDLPTRQHIVTYLSQLSSIIPTNCSSCSS
jgi:hypothetical protein